MYWFIVSCPFGMHFAFPNLKPKYTLAIKLTCSPFTARVNGLFSLAGNEKPFFNYLSWRFSSETELLVRLPIHWVNIRRFLINWSLGSDGNHSPRPDRVGQNHIQLNLTAYSQSTTAVSDLLWQGQN